MSHISGRKLRLLLFSIRLSGEASLSGALPEGDQYARPTFNGSSPANPQRTFTTKASHW